MRSHRASGHVIQQPLLVSLSYFGRQEASSSATRQGWPKASMALTRDAPMTRTSAMHSATHFASHGRATALDRPSSAWLLRSAARGVPGTLEPVHTARAARKPAGRQSFARYRSDQAMTHSLQKSACGFPPCQPLASSCSTTVSN